MSGHTVYLPDWSQNTCAERDAGLLLLLEWEPYWSSNSMEACCNEYFEYDRKCGLVQDHLYYYPNQQDTSECLVKLA
jgi:hypothetical protein